MSREDGAAVIDIFTGRRRGAFEEPFVDKAAVAEFLGVSTRTVERYVRDRGLPAHKPFAAGCVRFRLSEVDTWWTAASS